MAFAPQTCGHQSTGFVRSNENVRTNARLHRLFPTPAGIARSSRTSYRVSRPTECRFATVTRHGAAFDSLVRFTNPRALERPSLCEVQRCSLRARKRRRKSRGVMNGETDTKHAADGPLLRP